MAIITELFMTRNDGMNLYRTYSDLGMRILQVETGSIYNDAVDIDGAPYTYIEYEDLVESETIDPEDIYPEISGDIEGSTIMTRAELTKRVNEIGEALDMILSGVTE